MNIYRGQYSISAMMEIGRRGLAAQQANMSITGNNITNVNTEGYTRQRIELNSSTPLQALDMNVESGVLAETTRRMRDTFFDIQMREENPAFGRWEEESHQLGQVENILNEPNEMGVSSLLDKFFKSWEQLTHDPQSTSARTVVRDAAQSLTENFNRISKSLDSQQQELDDSLLDNAQQANYYIREIASYTKKIMQSEVGTPEISTLMDQRDLALDNLSQLIDLRYEEKDSGDMLVYCNGIIVAQKGDFNQITTETPSNTPFHEFKWANENTEFKVQSGKMKALLNVRDEVIPQIRDDLNELVKNFVEQINAIHTENYTLEGNNNFNFFDAEGLDISTIKLDAAILDDVMFIAASKNAGAAGNGDGALEIVELANKKCLNNNSETLKNYYMGIVTGLGTYTKETEKLADMQKTFVTLLESRRNESSKVDLNEELSNMIKFQQSFGACTKVISQVDEMMRSLLALV